jgi:hypothetical protein
MSKLETAVAPVLTPMIEGQQRGLLTADVSVIRTWATKTALNFAYFSEHAYTLPIVPELGHQVFAARDAYSPVPNVQVWVAAYEPLGQFAYRFMTAQGYGIHPSTGDHHQVLRAVFIAGHAVFYVRLPDSEIAQGLGWRDPLPEFTHLLNIDSDQAVPWRRDPLGAWVRTCHGPCGAESIA